MKLHFLVVLFSFLAFSSEIESDFNKFFNSTSNDAFELKCNLEEIKKSEKPILLYFEGTGAYTNFNGLKFFRAMEQFNNSKKLDTSIARIDIAEVKSANSYEELYKMNKEFDFHSFRAKYTYYPGLFPHMIQSSVLRYDSMPDFMTLGYFNLSELEKEYGSSLQGISLKNNFDNYFLKNTFAYLNTERSFYLLGTDSAFTGYYSRDFNHFSASISHIYNLLTEFHVLYFAQGERKLALECLSKIKEQNFSNIDQRSILNLMGFSWGASALISVIDEAASMNFSLNLAITIDPVTKSLGVFNNFYNSSDLDLALNNYPDHWFNFYQENTKFKPWDLRCLSGSKLNSRYVHNSKMLESKDDYKPHMTVYYENFLDGIALLKSFNCID